MSPTTITIHGHADHGFAPVADAFQANFSRGREVGAALTVYLNGQPVVDLWAGSRDRGSNAPWAEDTLALLFSVSKSLLSIATFCMHQDGLLDVDAPIAQYWPTFAGHGKEAITPRMVLSHRAGLAYLETPLTRAEVLDWRPVIRAIEGQEPNWIPDSGYAYHAVTFGYVLGELIRRITGQSVREYFQHRLAAPLALETFIGLPSEQSNRIARTESPLDGWSDQRIIAELAADFARDGRQHRALSLGSALRVPVPGISHESDWNEPSILAAEIPAVNAVSTAHSVAKLHAAVVSEVEGVRLLAKETVVDATAPRSAGDPVYGLSAPGVRIASGFMLGGSPVVPMLGPHSFGHNGAGGALGFADPETGVGFGYVNNQMGGIPDDRAANLCAALARCLP